MTLKEEKHEMATHLGTGVFGVASVDVFDCAAPSGYRIKDVLPDAKARALGEVMSQQPRRIFHLSTDQIEKIKREPHLAWDYLRSTKLGVYAPRIDSSEIKLVEIPDSKDRWHVDIIPCYTHQHFCLLVRIDSISIVSKDRAYQNGGGFALLLATPKEGNQDTDEFTVFGICPFEERERERESRCNGVPSLVSKHEKHARSYCEPSVNRSSSIDNHFRSTHNPGFSFKHES